MTPNAFSSHQKPAIAITDTTKLDIGPYLFAVVSLVHIFYQGCSVGHNNGVLSLQSIFSQPTGRLGGLLLTDRLLPKGPSRISLDRELWHTCDKNLVLKILRTPISFTHHLQPYSSQQPVKMSAEKTEPVQYDPKNMVFRRLGASGLRVPVFSLGGCTFFPGLFPPSTLNLRPSILSVRADLRRNCQRRSCQSKFILHGLMFLVNGTPKKCAYLYLARDPTMCL